MVGISMVVVLMVIRIAVVAVVGGVGAAVVLLWQLSLVFCKRYDN